MCIDLALVSIYFMAVSEENKRLNNVIYYPWLPLKCMLLHRSRGKILWRTSSIEVHIWYKANHPLWKLAVKHIRRLDVSNFWTIDCTFWFNIVYNFKQYIFKTTYILLKCTSSFFNRFFQLMLLESRIESYCCPLSFMSVVVGIDGRNGMNMSHISSTWFFHSILFIDSKTLLYGKKRCNSF